MSKAWRFSLILASLGLTAGLCSAQLVTSARSGTLHYFDGAVAIDGNAVQPQHVKFPEIKENSVLSTTQGRAEVLLTPGVFLRIGENSSIKMLDSRLVSTRVEILSGNAIIESDDPQMDVKDSPVTLLYKDYEIRPIKHGLFEIDADPGLMKVYKGEAVVTIINGTATDRATVKEGKQLNFSVALLTETFNSRLGDDLYLWARDRSESISVANMSSAQTLNPNTGYSRWDPQYSGAYFDALSAWNGGWYFNPYFNMYTFVPAGGAFWNAFGFGFFSPSTIYAFYTPGYYWYGGGGARGVGSSGWFLPGLRNATSNRAAPLSSIQQRSSRGVSFTGASPRGYGESGFTSPGFSPSGVSSGGSGGGDGFSGRSAGGIGGGGLAGGGHAVGGRR